MAIGRSSPGLKPELRLPLFRGPQRAALPPVPGYSNSGTALMPIRWLRDRNLFCPRQLRRGLEDVQRQEALEAPRGVFVFQSRRDGIDEILPGFTGGLGFGYLLAESDQIVVEVTHVFGRGHVAVAGDKRRRRVLAEQFF